MMSTPEDRDAAERRKRMVQPCTAPQLKRRAQREIAFNAGYDAATLWFAERMGLSVNLAGARHIEARGEQWRVWEYSEDR